MVRAVEPLYVPEKVRVLSVAVRFARSLPSEMPEIVELASIAFEIAPLSTVHAEPLQVNEPKSVEARSATPIRAVETTPEAALRKPVRVPSIVVPVTVRFVDVALVVEPRAA